VTSSPAQAHAAQLATDPPLRKRLERRLLRPSNVEGAVVAAGAYDGVACRTNALVYVPTAATLLTLAACRPVGLAPIEDDLDIRFVSRALLRVLKRWSLPRATTNSFLAITRFLSAAHVPLLQPALGAAVQSCGPARRAVPLSSITRRVL